MIVIAICGATSTYGSHADRKTTLFSMKAGAATLSVRGFELPQDLVAAPDRFIERLLRGLLARENGLHFLLDHLAPLHEVAEAQALRVGGRRLLREHLDRDFGPGVLVVEAGLLRHLVGRIGDRHVARARVPIHLDLRARQEGEEVRRALALVVGLTAHDPDRL